MPALKRWSWVIVCSVVFFVLGRCSVTHNLITYSVDARTISVPRNLPVYGLPISEYVVFLTTLKRGDSDKTMDYLEDRLDVFLYDALARHKQTRGKARTEIGKCLRFAAAYRERNPRAWILDGHPNQREKIVETGLKEFAAETESPSIRDESGSNSPAENHATHQAEENHKDP